MRAARDFLGDRRANAASEFAFILPVMLIFMGGIVEFGRWFQAYDGVNRLASRYASAYADCNDNPTNAPTSPQACKTELGLYYPAAALKNIAPQLTNGTPQVRMFQVQYSATGSPTVVYQYPTGATMSSSESQAAKTVIYTPGFQQTGVLVTINYTYSALFFSSVFRNLAPNANFNLTYTIAQRKS